MDTWRTTREVKIILAILLLWVVPCRALTLSQLLSRTRIFIRDNEPTRQEFTDSQLTDFVNDGARDLVNKLKPVEVRTSFNLVAATTFYTLPSDFLAVTRCVLDGRRLVENTLQGLDAPGGDFTVDKGKPVEYVVRFTTNPVIGFHPAPTTGSTGTVTLDYNPLPVDMSAGTDTPLLAWNQLKGYHVLLAYYASYRAMLVEGRKDDAGNWLAEYTAGLELVRTKFPERPNYRPGLTGRMSNP